MEQPKQFPVFIAIVDDEPDLAYLFRDALNQIPDTRVFAFSNPLLALEHIRTNSEHYLCVISDYRMPILNGIELLAKVKEIDSRIKRILISAFDVQDQVSKIANALTNFCKSQLQW